MFYAAICLSADFRSMEAGAARQWRRALPVNGGGHCPPAHFVPFCGRTDDFFVKTDKFSRICKKGLIFFAISVTMYLVDKSVKEVPAMAKCEICGKGVTFGIKVSHSHRRTNRTWKPNVQRVKAIVKGSPCHIYVCSRCLRSGKVERANG